MKVAIFGATGRTGRPLVKEALERGHAVTAFARDPSRLGVSRDRLVVVRGDVTDASAVERAVSGQDAVVSALGHAKGSPKDVQTRGTANIVAAMEKHGARRLVSLTGAGVRTEGDEPKLVDKVFGLLLKTLQRDVLEDAEGHVAVIRASGLEWVVVRGPRLTEGEKKGQYRVGLVGKNSGTSISRADLADFMLDQLTDDAHLGRMPVVSY
ncbi:NAD(P)H-binding protein [Rubrobacter tropicus]|uniref:NAD(P)H-binding protein n=1 Tax=Rubrobacter tropicus TaxID=2653851 RepID=A0A6G8Q6G5_9ACTN|nr:SDR family oxidoreductase [Rubrobacter tropicus]QIN82018.1 NAD(P)H-binding protein [Rubrobacter tropicus]